MYRLIRDYETFPDLAVMLWHSFGTIASLLCELMRSYCAFYNQTFTSRRASRVIYALKLLCVTARNNETRPLFVKAGLIVHLYKFLQFNERVCLSALEVIAVLVVSGDELAISHLMKTEAPYWCIRVMEYGAPMPMFMATVNMLKILKTEVGSKYICDFKPHLQLFLRGLENVVNFVEKDPSDVLLVIIGQCYFYMSVHRCARPFVVKSILRIQDKLINAMMASCISNVAIGHLAEVFKHFGLH